MAEKKEKRKRANLTQRSTNMSTVKGKASKQHKNNF